MPNLSISMAHPLGRLPPLRAATPGHTLATLAQAYIAQSYSDTLTPDIIASETHKTLIRFLGDGSGEDMSQRFLKF